MSVQDAWVLALESVDHLNASQGHANRATGHMSEAKGNLANAMEYLEKAMQHYQAVAENLAAAITESSRISPQVKDASRKLHAAGALSANNEQVSTMPYTLLEEAEYFEGWTSATDKVRNRMSEMVASLSLMLSLDGDEQSGVVSNNLQCVAEFAGQRNPVRIQVAGKWSQGLNS